MSKIWKHFSRLKYIILFLFIMFVISGIAIGITGSEPVFKEQLSYSLDLDAPLFNYTQTKFNTTEEQVTLDFTDAANKTIWIILPKDSHITKAEFNLTGIIKPYKQCIGTFGQDNNVCAAATSINDLEVGEVVPSSPGNEIGIASGELVGTKNTIFIANRTGGVIWADKASTPDFPSEDGYIGNFTADTGNEYIVGGDSYGISVYNSSGSIVWNYTTGGTIVYAVSLGNITGGPQNEIVYGDENGNIVILNDSSDTGSAICTFSDATSRINSVMIGDIDEDGQNEILASSNDFHVYIINSTCQKTGSYYADNYKIQSIAIHNITSDTGKELILGAQHNQTSTGIYYMLNSTLDMKWNRTHDHTIQSVSIGEFDNTNPGPEIIGGTVDYYLHLLDSDGTIYWTYLAGAEVSALAIGNVSEDTGSNTNEIVLGTMGGPNNLEILNFDSFPTNITLDLGNDGTKEWNYSIGDGRLRNSTLLDTTQIITSLNNYLTDNCTQRLCTIPLTLSSSVKGILNTRVNITYTYNASSDINYTDIEYWTKTENLIANESVTARAKNITFTDPPLNITIKYIKMNTAATQCFFNGSAYINTTIGNINYCNISSRDPVFKSTPTQNTSKILWDNLMQKEVPVSIYTTASYFTEGQDNYYWKKNITLKSNNTYNTQTFTNITANITLNDSSDAVRGGEYLNVTWSGTTCNLIPDTPQATCDTSPPETPVTCDSDTFYVCKKDINSNGIFEFIKWIHPLLDAIQEVFYEAGGTSNLYPVLDNGNVSPPSGTWESYFNYSISVNDTEGDLVNISLHTYSDLLGTWLYRASKNITSQGIVWFNISLEKEMTGTQNKYRFSFEDFNTTWSSPIHKMNYTLNYTGPNVTRHDIEITETQGNNSDVARGTNSTFLLVRINDTTLNEFIDETGVSCTYNVTYDGTNYKSGYVTEVNGTGYCNYTFTPDSTYRVGRQVWMVTVDPRYYLAPSPPVNWTTDIIGRLNITLTNPTENQAITRNTQMNMTAHLIDQYGRDINTSTINISDYRCSWYFNNTYINTTAVKSDGYCNDIYVPPCDYTILKDYDIEVKLNYTNPPENYTIIQNSSSTNIRLLDALAISIDLPINKSAHYKGERLTLNSTIADSCSTTSTNNPSISWYMNLDFIKIYVNETVGIARNNTPVIITGAALESAGADLTGWLINSTKIIAIDSIIPNKIFESAGIHLNTSSKIVFLINHTAYSNNTYLITHNETDVSGAYTTSYISNGGFEDQTLSPWTGDGIIVSDNTEPKGNNSLKLSVYSPEEKTDTITQTLYPLTTKNIKIWYKQKGEYDSGANTYLNITIGSYFCNLSLVYPTIPSYDGPWNTFICNDPSIIGKENMTITLHTDTITSAVDVYIDHICPADDNGNCISEDYGYSENTTIMARELINTSEDTSWNIPITYSSGTRKITAVATGSYYITAANTSEIDIYGQSSISSFEYSSAGCIGSMCFTGSTLDLSCKVIDTNTTSSLANYNVSFYDGTDLLNKDGNFTGIDGIATYSWSTPPTSGDHTISCNISDSPALYYNVSSPSSNSTLITLSDLNTTATLSFIVGASYLNSSYKIAKNISKEHNDLIDVTIFINNTGSSFVASPNIIAYNQSGINIISTDLNVAIPIGGNYTTNISVDISRYAGLGNTSLNVSLTWQNSNVQFINQSITVNVTNTTILEIINKTPLEYSIPYGGTKPIGNITIESYGNTPLKDIRFSIIDGDYQELSNWAITYSDESFDIARYGNKTITITVTVPANASLVGKSYWAYIIANNTGSACIYNYENCTDKIKMNLTIENQDWELTPKEDISKTLGIGGKDIIGSFDPMINITNLKNQNLTINISIIKFNATDFLNFTYIYNSTVYQLDTTESTFTLPSLSSFTNINISYNISDATLADKGTYTYNITIKNLDSTAVPRWINKTIRFTISALNLEITSPNASSPATGILAGDILNFTFNVTYDGITLNDTENTTFTIKISGENCPIDEIIFNPVSDMWSINCTAPQIPNNIQNNTVDATVVYDTLEGAQISYTTTQVGLIIYRDITAPSINQIRIDSIPIGPENEPNIRSEDNISAINIEINTTDNVEVTNVWLDIISPNGTIQNIILTQNTSVPDFWNTTYSDLNLIGDYKIIIYANDSIENHTTESTAWFDVYKDISFTDTLKDATDNIITADFRIYKQGTDWMFHRFTTDSAGHYNWTLHKRTYDISVTALNQEIRFNNFNITKSAINKTGQVDPSTLAGAIKLHLIPNSTAETNASNIDLPNTAENILMAFVIHTPNMTYDNATVALDYSNALSSWASTDENDIRLYYCINWDFDSLVCDDGEFTEFDTSIAPDVNANTFTFNTTHNSAYALAKWCSGNVCGSSPPGDTPGTSGGDSGGGSTQSSVCGNGICETGENEQNCPLDCSYHVCGNSICEPTENKYNCPLDCSEEEFEYTTDEDFTNLVIAPGANQTHSITIKNNNNHSIDLSITTEGDIKDYLKIIDNRFTLKPQSNRSIDVHVHTEKDTIPDTYSGSIKIISDNSQQVLPVIITVSDKTKKDLTSLDMVIEILTKKVTPQDTLRFNIMLYNLGIIKDFNVTLIYNIKDAKEDTILKTLEETIHLKESINLRKSIDLKEFDTQLPEGQYFIDVSAVYGTKKITGTDTFEVVQSFWETTRGQTLIAIILLILLSLLTHYGYRRYRRWVISKARYVFPLDYKKLPHAENAYNLGKIAETNKTAHYNPDDLTTHILTSGSTGSGKSVAASIFVEEALKQKVPVVVFDPTAQWTGFVRPCKDNNLLRYYNDFGMRPEDARPFTGMIFEVTDPNVKIDFKKYMNPGEITVFTLNKLKPGEYDTAVQSIIDTIFQVPWEESTTLKMIIVFDEVHRLLEKYGGSGGYVSLEKACREFRKWGIGMIMCSQVYSDFKEAIQGNILTEIQLNTKSMSDIAKVKEKYGPEYSEKISREGVGVGMIQNPRYNDGKPWFINFRPTMHSPHKITEEELNIYKNFAEKLEKIEAKIESLKNKNVNVMDFELELKLAKTKLKQGHFKMAEIYIESLLNHRILRD